MSAKSKSLKKSLSFLISKAKENEEPISLKKILGVTAGRGYAILLILFVLPFCLPIQIPGFSTFFGLILMFIGLRIAFGHRSWVPKRLLDKTISGETLEKIGETAIKITDKLTFFTSPRWKSLVKAPILRVCHGCVIAFLAFLLALPLPIPLTNLLTAYPILFFGLGLLEDDGIMILIGYFLFFVCLIAFSLLFLFGKNLSEYYQT
jgi:hypothetical protein